MGLAGFVLVGGKSSRMGENKALLNYSGCALAQHVAVQVAQAAGSVCLAGNPEIYGALGYSVIADRMVGAGPLGGVEAVLHSGAAREWNLIVACDMPALDSASLAQLCRAVETLRGDTDCLVPQIASGQLQPLCALYRKRCANAATSALRSGLRRMLDWIALLHAEFWPVSAAGQFQNVNTPPDWAQFLNDRRISPLS
ncbi:MAG: molybdenum cofactor guanylyltransferase [Acidobacteriota bacterium]|nr:molybdenum cofactor guanylyltransferase [Acidobacteriota bacterium]